MNCELCDMPCEILPGECTFACKCGGNAYLYYNLIRKSLDSENWERLSIIVISYLKHDSLYIINGKNIYYIENKKTLLFSPGGGIIEPITNDLPGLPTKELVEYCKSLLCFI